MLLGSCLLMSCAAAAAACVPAREKLGREYMTVVKQRKNIVTNIIRQAAGEMQLRINLHSVDTHPEVGGGVRSDGGVQGSHHGIRGGLVVLLLSVFESLVV
jgi:hypothetical protein